MTTRWLGQLSRRRLQLGLNHYVPCCAPGPRGSSVGVQQSSGLKRTTGLSAVLTCRDAPRGRAYEAQSVALQGPPDWAERPTRLTGGAQPVRSSSSTQATLAIDQCVRQLVP